MGLVDAGFLHTNGYFYFFKRHAAMGHYARYEGGVGVKKGYPRPMSEWSNLENKLPHTTFKCAFRHHSENAFYFFSDTHYVKSPVGGKIGKSYPKSFNGKRWDDIKSIWNSPGVPSASVLGSSNKKYYFFKDDQYARYDQDYKLEYVRNTLSNSTWSKDLPAGGFDAVVASTTPSIYYFFKADKYWKYDGSRSGNKLVYGVEGRDIRMDWSGLFALDEILPVVATSAGQCSAKLQLWRQDGQVVSTSPQGLALKSVSTFDLGSNAGKLETFDVIGLEKVPSGVLHLKLDSNGPSYPPITVRRASPATGENEPNETIEFAFASCLNDAANPNFTGEFPGSSLNDQEGNIKGEITILERIADNTDLDFMIWGGDSSYYVGPPSKGHKTRDTYVERSDGDMETSQRPWSMFRRQLKTRCHPSVARIMANLPVYSTWDDHDFGYNDADSDRMTTGQKNDATEVFRNLWPNDYDKPDVHDAIDSRFRWGGIEFFLPDGRSSRTSRPYVVGWKNNFPIVSNRILGDERIAALHAALRAACDTPLKIIVLGSQLISGRENGEGFAEIAPYERDDLLERLSDPEITGRVLLLTGDVHWNELRWYGGSSHCPKIVEATSSMLLLKSGAKSRYGSGPTTNSFNRVWGSRRPNYLHVKVGWNLVGDAYKPEISLRWRSLDGQPWTLSSDKNKENSKVAGVFSTSHKSQAVWRSTGELEPLTDDD